MKFEVSGGLADLLPSLDERRDELARALRGEVERAARRFILEPLRADTRRGLSSDRLPTTWRLTVYPTNEKSRSLQPAAFITSRAPDIIRAFESGMTIRPSGARYLAVPTAAVPTRGRKRATMRDMEREVGPYTIAPSRNGNLVVLGRVSGRLRGKVSRRARTLARQAAKRRSEAGERVAYFILVRESRLKKRLDVKGTVQRGVPGFVAALRAAVTRMARDR